MSNGGDARTVTTDDLRDVRDTIVEEMRTGFRGVHTRQDATNGRINQAERLIDRHDVRLTTLEKHPSTPPHGSQVAATDEDRPALTRREWRLLVGVVGACICVIELAHRFLPVLRTLLTGQP